MTNADRPSCPVYARDLLREAAHLITDVAEMARNHASPRDVLAAIEGECD
jgi:hypothetical protein